MVIFCVTRAWTAYIWNNVRGRCSLTPHPMALPALSPVLMHPKPSILQAHVVLKQAPKLMTKKASLFWHWNLKQHARAIHVSTGGDQLLQRKKHKQHHLEYHKVLRVAQGKIRELAQGLKDYFGKYGVEHYHKDLIHYVHKKHSMHKVNPWNTFQKLLEPPQWRGPAARGFVEMPKIPPKQ